MGVSKIVLLLSLIALSTAAEDCSYGTVFDGEKCAECGRTSVEPNVRIVGGIEAAPHSWPSQILLRQRVYGTYTYEENGQNITNNIDSTYSCGGTLINSQTVLTASHCITSSAQFDNGVEVEINFDPELFPTLASTFTVYLGAHDIGYLEWSFKEPEVTIVEAKVAKVLKHPQYNVNGNLENDIALLILTEPVSMNYAISPACLPQNSSNTYPGTNLTAYSTGWGALFEGFWGPDELHNVDVTIYDSDKCENATTLVKDYDKQICAGDIYGYKDTCQGDSGGPLYIRNEVEQSVRNIVVGVVSYGLGCARTDLPGIYTRVSHYLDWIKSNWEVPQYLNTAPMRTTTTTTTTTRSTTPRRSTPPRGNTTDAPDTCPYGEVYDGARCSECGLTSYEPNVKIVGGIEAVPHSWPSQVLIRQHVKGTYTYTDYDGTNYTYGLDGVYSCGGTLINAQTVLTAGHCITSSVQFDNGVQVDIDFDQDLFTTLASTFTVYLGAHDISYISLENGNPEDSVVEAAVHEVIKHPQFDASGNLENDIALLILYEPVTLNYAIKPACLPSQVSTSYPGENRTAYSAGWGSLFEGFWGPDQLHNVDLTIYSGDKCLNATAYTKDFNKQICAGDLAGYKDTCQGDSGGPLFVRETGENDQDRNIVVGIVSYGLGCARNDLPAIYTRVSYYLDWIRTNWKVPQYTVDGGSPLTTTPETEPTTEVSTTEEDTTERTTKKHRTSRRTTHKRRKTTTKRRHHKTTKRHRRPSRRHHRRPYFLLKKISTDIKFKWFRFY